MAMAMSWRMVKWGLFREFGPAPAGPLSPKQLAMLTEAAWSADGTVGAIGFGNWRHSPGTGDALVRRGLLTPRPAGRTGMRLFDITDAGRRLVVEKVEKRS